MATFAQIPDSWADKLAEVTKQLKEISPSDPAGPLSARVKECLAAARAWAEQDPDTTLHASPESFRLALVQALQGNADTQAVEYAIAILRGKHWVRGQ